MQITSFTSVHTLEGGERLCNVLYAVMRYQMSISFSVSSCIPIPIPIPVPLPLRHVAFSTFRLFVAAVAAALTCEGRSGLKLCTLRGNFATSFHDLTRFSRPLQPLRPFRLLDAMKVFTGPEVFPISIMDKFS